MDRDQSAGSGTRTNKRASIREKLRRQTVKSPTAEGSKEGTTEISDRRKALQQRRQRGLTELVGRRESMRPTNVDERPVPGTSPAPEDDVSEAPPLPEEDDYLVTTIDHPVHVFPLDFYPPSFLDKETGKRVLLPEHAMQPMLYADGSRNGLVCDCTCLDCSFCCAPSCIALLGGMSGGCGAVLGAVSAIIDDIIGPSSTPGFLSRLAGQACSCITDNLGVRCTILEELNGLVALVSDFAQQCTGGCGVQEQCSACASDASARATACYDGSLSCVSSTYSETMTCIMSTYSAIVAATPQCNQHQVIYHELSACYRQLTSCCR